MRTILETLAKRYDMILVDAPPLLSVADARIIAPLTDALILVLRAGVTNRESAMEAYQRIQEDGLTLLGTVLLWVQIGLWVTGYSIAWQGTEDVESGKPQLISLFSLAGINLQEGDAFSGVFEPNFLIGRTAVDLLTRMLQNGERGIPEHPLHQLIDGKWSDGKTIAMLNRKSKSAVSKVRRTPISARATFG